MVLQIGRKSLNKGISHCVKIFPAISIFLWVAGRIILGIYDITAMEPSGLEIQIE